MMDNRRSFRTADFKKQVQRLPEKVQMDVLDSFELWKEGQPVVGWQSLNCAAGKVWSARINYRHRALATELPMPDGSVCWMWFWAGTREDYEHVIKSSKLQAAQKQAVETYQTKFAKRAVQQKRDQSLSGIVNALSTAKAHGLSMKLPNKQQSATLHSDTVPSM